MTSDARQRFILRVTAGYTVLALGWMVSAQQLFANLDDVESMVWLSSANGVLFVVVSAAGLHVALRSVPSGATGAERVVESLVNSLVGGGESRRLAMLFAVVATLAMLLIHLRLATGPGQSPLLILFMMPIVLSALFGGLWPGLLATVLAALGVDYMAIPPVRSLHIDAGRDLLQWSVLIVNGVAVSLLGELLRRYSRTAELHRRLFDSVISGTPDAVFVKDAKGRYLLANAATAAIGGRQEAELIGHDEHLLLTDDDARRLIEADRAIMASGRMQTGEEHVVTRDGRGLVFLATKGPVFDAAGRAVGLFCIAHEITARKRAESEIRLLNAELKHRANDHAAQLQSANRELEDLAYALTHNLRAPLRAIGGFSRLMFEDHAAELSDDAAASLEQVVRASDRMGELLDGILAMLRSTRGELRRQVVDVSELATRQLGALAQGEPGRRVAVHVDTGLAVVGDRRMLEAALGHLLDNAWKFTGGRDNAQISVCDIGEGQGFCVADNGAGFNMAHEKRLFQPFQRLHREDEFPGIGIGLATVQRIVRRHGGDIRASGEPGGGTRFWVYLPPAGRIMEENNGSKSHPAGGGQPPGRNADTAGIAQDQPGQ